MLEEVKSSVLGYANNCHPEEPKNNLSPRALRGRRWIINALNNKEIFVSEADKGGAILIMNYEDVIKTLESELHNPENYELISQDPDAHLSTVTKKIQNLSCKLEMEGCITPMDRESITGLNDELNLKHNPEYRAVDPTIYPAFKVHKLTEKEISDKVVPPARFINNAKFGPLYRVEKWCSTDLTNISRQYCKDEYLKDTDDLQEQINALIEQLSSNTKPPSYKLFTLDVKNLYGSIQPEFAKTALKEALKLDNTIDENTKLALQQFSELVIDNAYIRYKDSCYRSKKGIATGGCISRQIADCTLHHLKNIITPKMPLWKFIYLFKRYIDDIFGLWLGTVRQFEAFIKNLNKLCKPFGIQFGQWQIGSSVVNLDSSMSINPDTHLIDYTLHRKPTDARAYLRTTSFHPPHIFNSIAYSQMLRVLKRNSSPTKGKSDISDMKEDLKRAGHTKENLDKLECKLMDTVGDDSPQPISNTNKSLITAVLNYSTEVSEVKALLTKIKPDIQKLIGDDVNVLVTSRKGNTLRNMVCKNSVLCQPKILPCTSGKCKTCPMLVKNGESLKVNGKDITTKVTQTCKHKNSIYIGQCQQCNTDDENTYAGKTMPQVNFRMTGHRGCFKYNDPGKIEKSAFSQHNMDSHPENFGFNSSNFKLMVYKTTNNPRNLHRLETIAINELRTNVWGLNRMYTQKH